MPATGNTQTGPSGHRGVGRGGRRQSGTAAHGPPDPGVLAREAVIGFLRDASKATAAREAARADAAAEAEATAAAEGTETAAEPPDLAAMFGDSISAASPVAAQSEAWRLAAVSASARTAVEAERQVKISLRLIRQNVVITTVLVAVVVIILVVLTSPLG